MKNALWTLTDFQNGHCKANEVGMPAVQDSLHETPEKLVEDLPPATMAELKQAALRVARGTGDYDSFLKNNPQFHQKFLLAMAKEAPPPVKQDLTVNISWLTSDRLAYRMHAIENVPLKRAMELTRGVPVSEEDVKVLQEAEGTEQRVAPPALPWREPEPDGLAKTMRDYGKKD